MAKFFACLAILLQLVSAIPQMSYPLNLQLPPVARAEAPYSFQFAPTTFSSSGRIQYSLIGNPFWLSLDGSSRTLSGTPHARDVGTVNFTVTAVEDGGVVVNMASQLLVSGDDGPTTKDDFSITLSAAGQISGSHAVTLKPSDTFDLSLPSDIFDSHGAALSYFALLSDRTPLPGWISFDATSMRFAGTVPPMDSTQSLQISLIASETPGFAAASVSFTMVISNHTLLFEPSAQTISATADDVVRITDLKEKLFLDDAHTDGDDIQSATADIPSWLSFDDKTFEIDGTVPPELESQDLSITAKSKFGDVANYTIHLVVRPKLFVGQIGTLILTSGRLFEHKLSRDDLATEVESVTADFGSLADYLHYDSATLTIRGTIPVDFPTEDVQCSLTATSGDGDNCVEDTQEFNISVSKAAVTSPTQAVGTVDSPRDGEDWKKIVTIIGAVLGGVFGILLLALFGFCLCRRKKQPKSQPNPRPSRKLRKHQITGPLSIRPEWLDMDENADDDMEKGKYTPDPFDARTPDRAHQLEFGSSNDRRDCHSVTESIGDADREILNEFEGSPFGFCSDTAPSQHPHSSMKIATDSGKRASQGSNAFRRHKRRATTVYQDQIHRSTGYPVHRRITGTGHDSYASSPPQSNANMSARGRPSSAASFLTTKTFSTSSSASPQSFNARKHTAFVTTPTEKRRSIRIVPASRRSSLTDERTIDEKRNSYFRNRASGSPFWGAGRRTSSSSYKSPPAFITAALSSPPAPLSHGNGNTGIRPDDDVMAGGEEIPAGLRIVQSPRELPETPKALRPLSESPKKEYPGSLRQNRINRPHTTLTPTRNRIEKSFARPSTTFSPSMSSLDRRSSTRHSLRAAELKASLNNLTGIRFFYCFPSCSY
jgi:axial budding pattern protein 2